MDLPSYLVADILSRLPVRTILHCKCVCKAWNYLLSEHYFVNLHLSRSPAGLVIHQRGFRSEPDCLKFGQLEDKPDHHDIHHAPLMRFEPKFGVHDTPQLWLSGSVDGLVCLWHYDGGDATYICNPVTREYILLPDHNYIRKSYAIVIYGFGSVASTKKYKVVRFYQGNFPSEEGLYKSECEVYTLGTGAWRSLGHVPFVLGGRQTGVFVNGNLHWLAYDQDNINSHELVCTFDMEKESFQLTASAPEPPIGYLEYLIRSLGLLRGCLCVCDNTSKSEFVIWLMKDYRLAKKSWTKEVVIRENPARPLYEMVHILTVFKDGAILMLFRDDYMFTYHPGTKTLQQLEIFRSSGFGIFDATVYVPSLIRLKSFMLEKVSVF